MNAIDIKHRMAKMKHLIGAQMYGILTIHVLERGKELPVPDKEVCGAEPLICAESDEDQGFSVFVHPNKPDFVEIPVIIYDLAKFKESYFEPIQTDPSYSYLTDWALDLNTLNETN